MGFRRETRGHGLPLSRHSRLARVSVEKRGEPRLAGSPQQRDRIKMCAEDVYVRRRGTARRATREFQPPLRGRLRRPYTLARGPIPCTLLCSQGISVVAATRKVPRVLYMLCFIASVQVETPQTHTGAV